MSALSRDQFVACLKESKAVDEEAVDSWMSRVDDEDSKTIAAKLVRDKLLTQWQAKMLLTGRTRLSLGNYLLRSRINRSELGDRFEAIHRQLGRKVIIQIFPASINKDEELRSRALRAMQQMTELDHPSLVHVYDVDQEGERFFVVTEFLDGTLLSELPRGELKDSDVASIIADLVAGVEYAHEQGVIHGNILQENIRVTAESRGKLQGLSTAAVQIAMSDSSDDLNQLQDLIAIVHLGRSVLQEVPPKQRGDGYESLSESLSALASAERPTLSNLRQELSIWLGNHGPKIPATPLASTGDDETDKSVEETPPLARPVAISNAPMQRSGSRATALKQAKSIEDDKSQPKFAPDIQVAGFLSRTWNEKRALTLTVLGAAAMMLVGAVGATSYFSEQPASTGGGNDASLVTSGNQDNSVALATPAAKKDALATNAKTPPEFSGETLADGEGPLSAARSQDAFDPEATKRKFEAIYAQRNAAENPTTNASPANMTPVAESKAVAPSSADAEETENANVAKSPVSKTVGGETGVAEKAMEKPASPTANVTVENDTPAAPVGNSLSQLPETIDLPASTQTGDHKIGDLVIDAKYLLGLKLLTGPEICKRKIILDLQRSPTDKQLWDIRAKRRKRDEPLSVAQIQKTAAELTFRWLPAAEEFDDANYIRNCKLKLSAGKEIRWIGLRQPVAVENFAFESARPSVKAEVDLKWLPDPQAMRIELDPFEVEDPNGDDQKGKVFFEPREVLKKAPAAIFFREKAELKFFFVEVGVELRKKLRMQAQMFAVGTDGTPRALRKPSDLTQLADILAARKAEAEQYQARILQAGKKAEVLKMFPELKDAGDFRKIKSSVKKATDLASQQHAACGDYMKIMENLSGCRIPFQIFFEIDGQRIKLAQSTAAPFSSQPPK